MVEALLAVLIARCVMVIIALGLDAYLGGVGLSARYRWHPVAIFGRLAHWLDDKLNRPQRSDDDRRFRGALAILLLLLAAIGLGAAIERAAAVDNLAWGLMLLMVTAMIDLAAPRRRAIALATALQSDGALGARAILPTLSERDPDLADEFEMARISIEATATALSQKGFGAIAAFLLFGLPGLLAYRTLEETVDAWAPMGRQSDPFSGPARFLWHPVNRTAALVSGIWLTISAAFTRYRFVSAAKTVWHFKSKASVWPQAAVAGALDIALGGPRRYASRVAAAPWIGVGRARLEPADVIAAMRFLSRSTIVLAIVLGITAVVLYL